MYIATWAGLSVGEASMVLGVRGGIRFTAFDGYYYKYESH